METKQTAVDWLFEKLWETPKDKLDWYALLNEAKAMEREQIRDAFDKGYRYDLYNGGGERYYNETYGK